MMFGSSEGPFSSAEEKMHQEMKSADGSSVDELFVRKMMAHHQGAVEMSEIVLEEGSDPDVLRIARKSIDEQRKDMEELTGILNNLQSA